MPDASRRMPSAVPGLDHKCQGGPDNRFEIESSVRRHSVTSTTEVTRSRQGTKVVGHELAMGSAQVGQGERTPRGAKVSRFLQASISEAH